MIANSFEQLAHQYCNIAPNIAILLAKEHLVWLQYRQIRVAHDLRRKLDEVQGHLSSIHLYVNQFEFLEIPVPKTEKPNY